MNELKKLEEAKHFFKLMKNSQNNQKDFEYFLSAFLNSSRSVYQYAYNECEFKTDGKVWYDKIVSNPLVQFLRDKRNLNIHTEPIKTQANPLLHITIGLNAISSLTVTDLEGNIISRMENSPKNKSENKVEHSFIYRFEDWSGNEDVITLCNSYMNEIENFIEEGKKLNFITG